MDQSGAYLITNTTNGKCYVGSAMNFGKRWSKHRIALGNNKHHSAKLQASWNKYGSAAFVFDVLEVTTREDAVAAEQKWMDFFLPGYNICGIAGSSLGRVHSVAAKTKISAANQGNTHRLGGSVSDETKMKMSVAHSGKKKLPLSDEHKEKLSAAQRGVKKPLRSDEYRANISAARVGKKHSAATKAKISATKLAKNKQEPSHEHIRFS